jgi:hypothetical protein
MSHVDTSESCRVTDLEALYKTIKEQCPELELVKQKTYKTWIDDHGQLVGDYPLPWIYQLKMLGRLIQKHGEAKVRQMAKDTGVELPANLRDIEKNPLTLQQQKKLLTNPDFKEGYEHVTKNVVGKDAEYAIRYKPEQGKKRAYEIGLVKNPLNQGEFLMMCDFFSNGNGLLRAKGMGEHKREGSKDTWGAELKHGYAVNAAERKIQQQIAAGHPEYGSYRKVKLDDGRVMLEVKPRNN